MPESHLIRRQGSALRDLHRLAEERAKAEISTKAGYTSTTEAAEQDYQAARQAIAGRFESESAGEERAYREALQGILGRFESERGSEEKRYQAGRRSIGSRFNTDRDAAKKAHEEARWEALTVYEAAKDGAKKAFDKLGRQVAAEREAFEPTDHDARALLEDYRGYVRETPAPAEPPPPGSDEDALEGLRESIARATVLDDDLVRLSVPRVVKFRNFAWFLPLLWAALIYPSWLALGWPNGALACTVAAVGLWVGLRFWLLSIARVQVSRLYPQLGQALGEVEAWAEQCKERASATLKRRGVEAEQTREASVSLAGEAFARRMAEIERRRDEALAQLEEGHARQVAEIERRRDEALAQLEEGHARRVAEINLRNEVDSRDVREKYEARIGASKASYAQVWEAMSTAWEQGTARVRAEVAEVNREAGGLFPDWSGPTWDGRRPAQAVPPGMRFGEIQVSMGQIPHGIPLDERLRAAVPADFALPALLPFPARGSLLIKAHGEGREAAVQALQAVMLRYLTSLPPGKVRFTIIDPVGLGQNFSAFMHLADFDEALINSRIWTEPPHIEQRLADLTDHMENVIQKYLRNEFETIEEYNLQAGEVAEPFRFLIIANFPVSFSESAARRLTSIATSGTRCGVYTLISVDMQQPMPTGFSLKDLEAHAVNLVWKDRRFLWRGSEFDQYPLKLDAPPAPEAFKAILQDAGAKAKEASRVEVPFEVIAPPEDRWWSGSSSAGIDVPLGRAGATRLQHLRLGKGTSQHVLIAGRTGSGKSTLLHALITNLALHYSPEEVELYLIDFKKGVEFKTYATHGLPHARVVAIESEREFGLSVLQRLDAELKYRGDRFRDAGAQDLNAYRQAEPEATSPRILLIVDEFQEFFVEDDKVAQEAALLLDRLVRQGRAFGIHVHLGSQTLSGAYSLARSTLGQMAVRIALQCSEADAHLILSEENSAARLLSRPGEAIYNDANGLVEGNHPFQVVWLPDAQKEDYLKRLHDLARQKDMIPAEPQIVFEGNKPADAEKNPLLARLLLAPAPAEPPKAARAWLGEAIAIKEPTAAVFRPQSGANLLVIGQQDESALGILATSLVGLAAQYPEPDQPSGARFFVFDGSPADSPNAGVLARLADVVPHPVQAVGWRDLPAVVADLATEVERRQAAENPDDPTLFLIVFDLQRFRDLRKADDDFGFGGMGEQKATPAKQFATILREGPVVRVHTLIWCDTLNNVNRTLDRQSLREFEMRILFQMSANDSSTLIDSPAANRLGPHRALFYSEEQGRLEKFRPYGAPAPEWLDRVRSQIQDRPPAERGQPLGLDAQSLGGT